MGRSKVRLYLAIVSAVLASCTALGMPLVARAATGNSGVSLTTSPVFLDLSISPGTSDTRPLQVMNNSRQPVTINMKLDVFTAQGTSGDAQITEPEPTDQSVSWVSFSPSSFVAKPGVWSTVKMTINLPASATLGYYYAVVFQPEVSGQQASKTALIKGANAILVLVDTHAGSESRQVEISDFTTDKGFYEYLPATFTVNVKNSGNIYLSPYGNVYVSKNSDVTNTIDVLPLNPGAGNILPHSSRNFQVQWNDGFPKFVDKKVNGQVVTDKNGQPVKDLSWSFSGLDKFRIGQYYAKVTLVYNDGKRIIPLSRVVSFWVFPWKMLGLSIVTFVVLVIGLLTIGRYGVKLLKAARIYRR